VTVRKRLLGGFVGAGLAVAFAVALFAGPFASSSPDGLGRVAIDHGFASTEKAGPVEDGSPVGGYAVRGVGHERVSTGLAGAIGVAATFALGTGAFVVLRWVRGGRRRAADTA